MKKTLIVALTLAALTGVAVLAQKMPGLSGYVQPTYDTISLMGKNIADQKTGLGIDTGTCTSAADGTVTNTFNITFSSAPKVTFSPVATLGTTNTMSAPTTTSVVFTVGEPSKVIHWIAIGPP